MLLKVFPVPPVPAFIWISGSSDGIGAEKIWSWCPQGQPVNSSHWWPGEPNSPGATSLVMLWNAEMNFGDGYSVSRVSFLCEVKKCIRYLCCSFLC